MAHLHGLWCIGVDSFRELIENRLHRGPLRSDPRTGASRAAAGEDVLADPEAVRAWITEIPLDAGAVWPWVAQLMRGGGMYGWPRLESDACRSADYLLDDLPRPAAGDRVGDLLEVARVEPGREIVWHAPEGVELLGYAIEALCLDYLLVPVARDRSRLIVRTRASCPGLTRQIREYLLDAVELILPSHQGALVGRCAESYCRRLAAGRVNRGRVPAHQALPLTPAPTGGAAPVGQNVTG